MIASERATYSSDGGATWSSYSEMMGLPAEQVTDSYVFPWYNSLHISTKIKFANVGTADTTVTVTIAGNVMGTYDIAPNDFMEVSYPSVNNGPVKVKSSGGVDIRGIGIHSLSWRRYLDQLLRTNGISRE